MRRYRNRPGKWPEAVDIADKVIVSSGRTSVRDFPPYTKLCKVKDPEGNVVEFMVSVIVCLELHTEDVVK